MKSIDTQLAYDPEVTAERFTVDSDTKAQWAVEKIKESHAEITRWSAFYNAQLDKIKREAESNIAFFTAMLEEYFQTVPVKTTKTGIEKYELPEATLQQNPSKIDYERDNAVLLPWCVEHAPELVRTSIEPAWADVKKRIAETGELPPGVMPIEKPPTFTVKIKEN